jgi:hypothetical protein
MTMTKPLCTALIAALSAPFMPGSADAQPLGTFRWQLQPFCNVLTVTITQVGSVYRLEGRDDQCGAARAASVIGTAAQNPDGTIGLGFNIVSAPAGVAQPVSAAISLATLSGTWLGAGASGAFVFTPGGGTGGPPRPAPPTGGGTVIPSAFRLDSDGSLVAGGAFGAGGAAPDGPGARMVWNPRKAAFRAGSATTTNWDDASIGDYSVAFGIGTLATGRGNAAFGENTTALGSHSVAFGFGASAVNVASTATGYSTLAFGRSSTAMGEQSEAHGDASTATGFETAANGLYSFTAGRNTVTSDTATASMAIGTRSIARGTDSLAGGRDSTTLGDQSLAFGRNVQADGAGSVALGSYSRALVQASGTFIFADRSTTTAFTSFAPNQFLVRAAGGVGIYTSAASVTGVELAPNGGQWLNISDVNAKHRFRDIDGEAVLTKLAGMPIQEWSYKAQDDAIRHVGPTAQDFAAAFGLGEDPLRIGTVDADGIALRAIQALEARTAALQEENRSLRERLDDLEARLATQVAPVARR